MYLSTFAVVSLTYDLLHYSLSFKLIGIFGSNHDKVTCFTFYSYRSIS
ncbi:hypothetical protein ALTER154_100501 [Alteromonas sp. 154]|nr:hypothetical protein ALTER154_100501 [Alteromonas sp. 154]